MKLKNHIISGGPFAFVVSIIIDSPGMSVHSLALRSDMVGQNWFECLLIGLGIGMLFPDVDRFILPIDGKGKNLFRRRGITHHLLFPMLTFIVGFVISTLKGINSLYLGTFLLAMGMSGMTHIFQDSFFYLGVPHPFKFDYRKRWYMKAMRTEYGAEMPIMIAFWVVTIFLVFAFQGIFFGNSM